MSAIVKIGYHEFYVQSDADALKIVQLLGKAAVVRDHSYEDKLLFEKDQLDIQMSIVRKPLRFVDAATGEPVMTAKRPNGMRKLKEQHVHELPWNNTPRIR